MTTQNTTPSAMGSSADSCVLQPGQRIAFIEAGWHKEIVEQSRFAFETRLSEAGIDAANIDLINVPGSLEIPLQCKLLAKTQRYQIIVAAGLIVDGGIYRHDFVASTVLDAMMQVSLQAEIPILSVVLTPHHFNDDAHHGFFFEHFKLKGREAGNACIQMIQNQQTEINTRAA